jgi:hypothetical protein
LARRAAPAPIARNPRAEALTHSTYSSLPNVTTLSKFSRGPQRAEKRPARPMGPELENKNIGGLSEKEKGTGGIADP